MYIHCILVIELLNTFDMSWKTANPVSEQSWWSSKYICFNIEFGRSCMLFSLCYQGETTSETFLYPLIILAFPKLVCFTNMIALLKNMDIHRHGKSLVRFSLQFFIDFDMHLSISYLYFEYKRKLIFSEDMLTNDEDNIFNLPD